MSQKYFLFPIEMGRKEKSMNYLSVKKSVGGSLSQIISFWQSIEKLVPDENGLIDGPEVFFKKRTETIGVFADKACEQSIGKVDFAESTIPNLNFENFHEILQNYSAKVIGYDPKNMSIHVQISESGRNTIKLTPAKTKAILIKETAKRTNLTESEIKTRLNLIEFYGIKNPFMLQKIAESISPQPKGEDISRPDVMYQQGDQKVIATMLIAASRGIPYLLEGPKSVGKNIAWETVSYLLNRKLFAVQCDRRMTKEDLFGRVGTDNSRSLLDESEIADILCKWETTKYRGEIAADTLAPLLANAIANLSPRLVINYGPVGRAILHEQAGYGSILLLDEMNLSDPSTFTSLFNMLTDRHSEYIEFDTVRLPIPKRMVIGGTQNGLGGEYIGTNALNGAAMNRWGVVKIAPPDSIIDLLKTVPDAVNVVPDDLSSMDKIYSEFVAAAKSGQISDAALNIRGFKAAVDMVACGIPVAQAVIENVVNSISDIDEVEDLTEIVNSIIK